MQICEKCNSNESFKKGYELLKKYNVKLSTQDKDIHQMYKQRTQKVVTLATEDESFLYSIGAKKYPPGIHLDAIVAENKKNVMKYIRSIYDYTYDIYINRIKFESGYINRFYFANKKIIKCHCLIRDKDS